MKHVFSKIALIYIVQITCNITLYLCLWFSFVIPIQSFVYIEVTDNIFQSISSFFNNLFISIYVAALQW